MKVQRLPHAPFPDRRQSILWAHALTGRLWVTNPDGSSYEAGSGGGGGGSSDHATLSNLSWSASGHTGTASRLAWFGSGGSASYLSLGSGLTTSGSSLVVDTGTIATVASLAGYVPTSRTITSSAPFTGGGALSADLTLSLSGWSGTTDGAILYRSGSSVASAIVSSPLSFTGGTLAIQAASTSQSGYLSSTDWNVFNNKSPAAGSTSIVTVGTITTGVWHGSTVGTDYGGTGLTTYTAGDIPYYSAGTSFTKLGIGTAKSFFTSSGSAPQWTANGDLDVSGGSVQVSQARGLRETSGPTTLTIGAIAAGEILVRSGTTVASSAFSALLSAYSALLAAIAGLGSSGIIVKSGASAYARSLTAGSGISITNADGTSGNPTIAATGSTNTDLDPTTGYFSEFWPGGGGSVRSAETPTVRFGSGTNNTSTQKRTAFTGSTTACDWYCSMAIRPDNNFTFKIRFWTGSSISATMRIKMGLTSAGGWTTTDTETASSRYIMLRYSTSKGDTNWKLVTNDGTTETVVDSGVAVAINTEYTASLVYSGNGTTVTLTINGTSVSNSTALPSATSDFTTLQCGLYAASVNTRAWYFVGAYIRTAY